jgi:hypothetical protein
MNTPEKSEDQPVAIGYYYKVKWGYQDEFLELFKKNHYPVLETHIKTGRYLRVETLVPKFHGDGRADWTFLTLIVYKNWQAVDSGSQEKQIIKEMYPDQETFKREEQRRFELVEAHWDIPLKPVPMA